MNTPPPPPPPPPSTPPPPPPSAPVPPAAPVKSSSGSKVLVIILCVVLGLFVLIGGCAVACTYFVAKKGKEYKARMEKNPQMTTLSTIVAMQPDLTVVSQDESTGHIKIKNKKTGEVTDIDTSQYSTDNISSALQKMANGMAASAPRPAPVNNDDSQNTSSASSTQENQPAPAEESEPVATISPAKAAALNASLRKFPNYVTAYPGGKTSAATLNTFGGVSIGNYEFTSSDKPDAITEYYEKKLTSQNFTVLAKNSDANDFGPTATLVTNRAEPSSTFTITAESQKNGTHVSVTFSNH